MEKKLTLNEVFVELQKTFDDVFLDAVVITSTLTALDVPEWTSLKHVAVVIAIEDRFNIRFRLGEVEATRNVGELAELILTHVATKK